jgi:hypothetical protein
VTTTRIVLRMVPPNVGTSPGLNTASPLDRASAAIEIDD